MCARLRLNAQPSFNVVNYSAKGMGKLMILRCMVQLTALQHLSYREEKHSCCNLCRSKFKGTISAPKSVETWRWPNDERKVWVQFSGISGLVINGGGKVDGQDATWWDSNLDINNKPTALQFDQCKNLRLSTLSRLFNSINLIYWGEYKKMTFEEIILVGAENPMIIDQQYSNLDLGETDGTQAVKITDVTYHNVRGTISGKNAIQLNCIGRYSHNL
ncbi:hypothetical protein VNO77_04660 [Canavalia gladiata]|uniref:Polygalacturonase n=1 Tax=Canavalia gladiata TaxID=3824 RepID=A0AAN9N2K3_CANGL